MSRRRVAIPFLLIRLKAQMRLTPQMALSGTVEQHQALWCSMKSSLFMSLGVSCCSSTRKAYVTLSMIRVSAYISAHNLDNTGITSILSCSLVHISKDFKIMVHLLLKQIDKITCFLKHKMYKWRGVAIKTKNKYLPMGLEKTTSIFYSRNEKICSCFNHILN